MAQSINGWMWVCPGAEAKPENFKSIGIGGCVLGGVSPISKIFCHKGLPGPTLSQNALMGKEIKTLTQC
jgi:hypothetical protein